MSGRVYNSVSQDKFEKRVCFEVDFHISAGGTSERVFIFSCHRRGSGCTDLCPPTTALEGSTTDPPSFFPFYPRTYATDLLDTRLQDPTLNLLFDRAFDEFRDTARVAEERVGAGDGNATREGEGDCSRMIGIVSRLGGGKRALAVGLGSGGPAGEPRVGLLFGIFGTRVRGRTRCV